MTGYDNPIREACIEQMQSKNNNKLEAGDDFRPTGFPSVEYWLDDMSVTDAGLVKDRLAKLNHTDLAVIDQMLFIHFLNRRPVCYYDLIKFRHLNQEYVLAYGTVRNLVRRIRGLGLIEDDVHVNRRKYFGLKSVYWRTMKGKAVTSDPTGIRLANNPIYRIVKDMPMQQGALHDIHLKTKADGIWPIMSKYSGLHADPVNKAIRLGEIYSDNLQIAVTIEHNDTVTATVACSYAPVACDVYGVMHLIEALTRAEERLATKIREFSSKDESLVVPIVPSFRHWIVTMWHFGRDSTNIYSGEKFEMTFGDAVFGLYQIYTKDVGNGKSKVRMERTEQPQKSLYEALSEKLDY